MVLEACVILLTSSSTLLNFLGFHSRCWLMAFVWARNSRKGHGQKYPPSQRYYSFTCQHRIMQYLNLYGYNKLINKSLLMYIQGSVGDEDWNCIHYVMLTSFFKGHNCGTYWQEYGEIWYHNILCSVLGRSRKWRNITVHLYIWTVYYVR
jgi:hypothetical protein